MIDKSRFLLKCVLLFLFFPLGCSYTSSYEHFLRLESTDGGEQEQDRIFIRFDEDVYLRNGKQVIPYEISTESEAGLRDCGIHRDDTSSEDKYCILDINEMDLLGNIEENVPFVLEYQIPRETCEYTSFYVPWHFNQLSGFGPPFMLKCTIEEQNEGDSNNEGDDSNVYWAEGRCTDAGCVSLCGIRARWLREDTEEDNWLSKQFCRSQSPSCQIQGIEDPRCFFDRSDDDEDYLSNCCFGDYRLESYEQDEERFVAAPSISTEDWGGSLNECIGGPGRLNWDTTLSHSLLGEYLTPRVFSTWERGLRESFEIEKPLLYDSAWARHTGAIRIHPLYFSIGISNYYEGIEDLEWSGDGRCDDCPNIFKSEVSNLRGIEGGDLAFSAQEQLLGYPYYTLECLDSNMEAIHRVHFIVREWNTLEEFYEFQDSAGDNGDPDVEGVEGEDCNYYDPDEFTNNCNDLYDLDDIIRNPRAAPPALNYPQINYGQ